MGNYMKFAFLLLSILFIHDSTFAQEKNNKCTLYISNPVINHSVYGPNYGGNSVNAGVVRIMMANGFKVTKNSTEARFVMNTDVKCSQGWTFFGLQDSCNTSITIYDQSEEEISFTDGPTKEINGLKIDFDNINFPKCSDL